MLPAFPAGAATTARKILLNDWNVVVTTGEGRYRESVRFLWTLGAVAKTGARSGAEHVKVGPVGFACVLTNET